MMNSLAHWCFSLILSSHNTRDYVSWVVDVSRDKRGMYTAHGAQMSPVSEELAQNGVELKMVTTTSGNQLSHLSDGLADPPSRDEVYESESECIGPMQHQNTEEQEAEDGEAEKVRRSPCSVVMHLAFRMRIPGLHVHTEKLLLIPVAL